MFEKINTILVVAPHPDDAEFGVGGTLSKLTEANKNIHIAVFSDCELSTPKGLKKGIIMEECLNSLQLLGLPESNIHLFGFPVRHFPKYRQEILEDLILLRKNIQPDLVFCPNSSDLHQDHETINKETKRAFKHTCLLGYEMPWNNFSFNSSAFVALKERHLQKKLSLISCYSSQKDRVYSSEQFLSALALLRGAISNQTYAECFEVIRYLDL